jgi:hypothetical protein
MFLGLETTATSSSINVLYAFRILEGGVSKRISELFKNDSIRSRSSSFTTKDTIFRKRAVATSIDSSIS